MRQPRLASLQLIFIFCSGNLMAAPFWDANLIANSSSEQLQLKDKDGKVYTSIKTGTVRKIIATKNNVEAAAGSIRAQLWIDAEEKPNAFATYSNNQPIIGINIGMIQILEEDEESYAALIGHELAHLYLGHPAKYANRNGLKQVGSIFLSFALGYAGVPAGGTIADITTTAISTVYSRDDERDADKEGMKYMLQAGYDPYGAVHMQEKLANASGPLIPFLSSHPSGSERIKDMRELAEIAKVSKTGPSNTKTIVEPNIQPIIASAPITNKAGIDLLTPVTQILLPDGTWGDPVRPTVMPDGAWEDLEQLPEKNPISTVDEAPTHPVSSEPSPSWSASPAQRLRELNALFKEGLIDENDYAKKKRKILDAM